jgi:hypothetical protein
MQRLGLYISAAATPVAGSGPLGESV